MNDLTQTLIQANGFDSGALPANQRGEMALSQRSLITSKMITPVIFIIALLAILIYQINQQGLLDGAAQGGSILAALRGLPTGTLVIGGILVGVTIWALVILIQLLLDLSGGEVRSLEGMGYRNITTSTDADDGKTRRFYYVIEGQKFQVKKEAFTALVDGGQYRVYYTPRRKILVNIEALS